MSPPSRAVNIEAERRAIRSLWDRAIDAIERADSDAYSSLWAHDAEVEAIHAGIGEWLTGWDVIGPQYRALLESEASISARTPIMHIHVGPSGDVAWAAMESHVKMADSQRVAWQLVVFRKNAGQWRLVAALDAPRGSA